MNGYGFAVPNGRYVVKMYFAESFTGALAPKRRLSYVRVDGVALPDPDIFAETGGLYRPLVRTVATTVTDGKLEILFEDGANPNRHAMINGIEIIPAALAQP
jgi:hypothetical protein